MREDQVDSSAFWGFLVAKEGLGEEGKAGSVRNRMQTVLSTMKEGMRRKCAVRVSLKSVQPSRCFDGLFTFFLSFFLSSRYIRHQAASSNSFILWLLHGLSEASTASFVDGVVVVAFTDMCCGFHRHWIR
jgi:hypothetical protein